MNKLDLQLFASGEFTQVKDVVVPALFAKYIYEKTVEKSELVRSGLATQNGVLDDFARGGGLTFTVPYFNDLSGDSETLRDDGKQVKADKITSGSQIATKIIRVKAWSATDLAGILAGADPLGQFMEQVARYWVREEQKMLLATLKGLFGGVLKGHLLDVSKRTGEAGIINAESVLDAKNLLGDHAGDLAVMIMHSNTHTRLQKQNLIQYVTMKGVDGSDIAVEKYMGYFVIVDDGMPVDTTYAQSQDTEVNPNKVYYTDGSQGQVVENPSGNPKEKNYFERTDVYTTYIFGKGAILRGEATPNDLIPIEFDRDSLASMDYAISRRCIVLHPAGFQWSASKLTNPEDKTPANVDLAKPENWKLALDIKKINIIALKHRA